MNSSHPRSQISLLTIQLHCLFEKGGEISQVPKFPITNGQRCRNSSLQCSRKPALGGPLFTWRKRQVKNQISIDALSHALGVERCQIHVNLERTPLHVYSKVPLCSMEFSPKKACARLQPTNRDELVACKACVCLLVCLLGSASMLFVPSGLPKEFYGS